MKRHLSRKLVLAKESIRALTASEQSQVHGGAPARTGTWADACTALGGGACPGVTNVSPCSNLVC
jgi:hypothetical protein